MNNAIDRKKERWFRMASESYRKSDEKLWVSAYACGKVVGNYDKGATMGLASDMGISSDTVEDLAHSYWLYDDLCTLDGGKFRSFVRNARKSPYIYYSHFRALYDAKQSYGLTVNQVLDLLMDIFQGEGQISSRGVDGHTRSRFGDSRDWTFYAARTQKELGQTLQQPDLPNVPAKIGNIYFLSFKTRNRTISITALAHNPQRGENIARKMLQIHHGLDSKESAKAECITNKVIGEMVTDSKYLLDTTYSWLGDNA